jgi:predicted kinase
MKRVLVMTAGKTHSGKSTFARRLAEKLPNTAVIDQDNQAEFLHTHYPALLPTEGPNRVKHALTRTLVEYAAGETDCHVVLCNANLEANSRQELLRYFREKGFVCILVNFLVPDEVLLERIRTSNRSRSVLRTAVSFEEVLARQSGASAPGREEAEHGFAIRSESDVTEVLGRILGIAGRT